MATDFRRAALDYAAEAERKYTDQVPVVCVRALVCGLVYVGDQVGRLAEPGPEPKWTPADVAAAAGEMPVASRQVQVVAGGSGSVILELDGQRHQVYVGGTITVPGLRVTQAPNLDVGRLLRALRRIAEYVEHIGDRPADEMRGIAREALTEFERGGFDG